VGFAFAMSDDKYFSSRFTLDPNREVLWKALCDFYFNRLVRPDDHVLELGAGYGYFVNNIRSTRRTAVDLWPGLRECAASGVNVHIGPAADLDFLSDHSVDFAFASNLFEHLTQEDFARTLAQLKRVLRPGGTLNILQPNYRRAYREYFDDYTHVSVYSDISLQDFLTAHGFKVLLCHPGLLPLTIKSRLPVSRNLIRAYLASPWKPMGKQMFLRAEPLP
jgi:SAM-dependent methyltransferase